MSTMLRLTIKDYDRLIKSGFFDAPNERRVELIYGELREMSPIGSRHEQVVDKLNRWSNKHTDERRVRVRIQQSVGVPELDSAPQPDIGWMKEKDYWKRRPTGKDVFLIIEVADSSLRYDRGKKANLYAAAGVADYWVVNVNKRTLGVFRSPSADGYAEIQVFQEADTVSPLAFPSISLRIADLFP